MELVDFLEDRLDITDPEFQSKSALRYEFGGLPSGRIAILPEGGGLFNHQKVGLRFLRLYDRLLDISEPGAGKSGLIFAASEYLKNDSENFIKRAVILSSKNVGDELKFQLSCRFAPGKYNLPGNKGGDKEKMSKFYSFKTYGTFASLIRKNYPNNTSGDRNLISDYTGTFFVIDEGHNLTFKEVPEEKIRIEKTLQGKEGGLDKEGIIKYLVKKFNKLLEDLEDQPRKYLVDLLREQVNKSRNKITKREIYLTLKRVFRVVKNIKILIATATPMMDNKREIIPLMNLLLSEESQIPKEIFINHDNLRPYFLNKIVFVKKPETGVIRERIEYFPDNEVFREDEIFDTGRPIYYSKMSKFQGQAYLDSFEENGSGSKIWWPQRSSSNFVFPDQSYGSKGYKKYILYNEKNNRYTDKNTKNPLSNYLSTPGDVIKLSQKFYDIVKLTTEDKGIFLVYCGDFLKSSGLAPLSMVYEFLNFDNHKGYEIYTGQESFFEKKKDINICGRGEDRRVIKVTKPKKARIAYIHGSVSTKFKNNILELLNSRDNMYGEYLKGILVSTVSGEGININNGASFHSLTSVWVNPELFQAENRIDRVTSHAEKIEAEKTKKLLKGQDPDEAKVFLRFYYHSSFYPDYYQEHEEDKIKWSIDSYIYHRAKLKDIGITEVFRWMKEDAIDCYYTKERNNNGIDYTRECDYQECNYVCACKNGHLRDDFGKEEKVESKTRKSRRTRGRKNNLENKKDKGFYYQNYDLLYSGPEIDKCIEEIKNILSEKYKTNLDYLVKETGRREMIVLLSLDKMIREKIQVVDYLGLINYIREEDNAIYLFRDRLLPTNLLTSYYNDKTIKPQNIGITQVESKAEQIKIESDILTRVLEKDITEIREELISLKNVDLLRTVLELSFIARKNESDIDNNLKYDEIIRLFSQNHLHRMTIPINEIKRIQKKKLPGKLTIYRRRKIEDVKIDLGGSNKFVFVHSINSLNKKEDFLRVKQPLRIFNEEKMAWETIFGDGTRKENFTAEFLAYSNIIRWKLTKKLSLYREPFLMVYSSFPPKNNNEDVHLVRRTKQKGDGSYSNTESSGIRLKSVKDDEIMELLEEFGVEDMSGKIKFRLINLFEGLKKVFYDL